MAARSDFRKSVTRHILWDAFRSLLEKQPIDSIHVVDICREAGMHRSTFYGNFEDKYELLAYGLHHVVLHEAGVTDCSDHVVVKSLPHRKLLEHVKEHQPFWRNIMVEGDQYGFPDEILVRSSRSFFDGRSFGKQTSRTPAEINAILYFGSVGNLTVWWLKENCATPVDELCEWIESLWHND